MAIEAEAGVAICFSKRGCVGEEIRMEGWINRQGEKIGKKGKEAGKGREGKGRKRSAEERAETRNTK